MARKKNHDFDRLESVSIIGCCQLPHGFVFCFGGYTHVHDAPPSQWLISMAIIFYDDITRWERSPAHFICIRWDAFWLFNITTITLRALALFPPLFLALAHSLAVSVRCSTMATRRKVPKRGPMMRFQFRWNTTKTRPFLDPSSTKQEKLNWKPDSYLIPMSL